jgi:hypothetical protein
VEFFDTEDEAIDRCRQLNRALNRPTCAVVDGPEDNYAVVDIDTARELLQPEETGLPCLIVTD